MDDFPPPDPDDFDDLAALDIYAPDADSGASDLDALFGLGTDGGDDGGSEPVSVVDAHLPDGGDDDEPPSPTFTVTNPPGTVTVTTFMDGRVHVVDLATKVTGMSEDRLAEEIVLIARLATQDARAAQYTSMLDGMRQQGHDDSATRDFLTRDLDLPSPEDATAARTQIFATRYSTRYQGEHD